MRETPKPVNYDRAAYRADWMQVVLNQGPPCFHLEDDRFCLRAERWFGHTDSDHAVAADHAFISLAALLDLVRYEGMKSAAFEVKNAVAYERAALREIVWPIDMGMVGLEGWFDRVTRAHTIDIVVRKDGIERHLEGDFLKVLFRNLRGEGEK